MGAFTKVIVNTFGIDLPLLEWFGLSAMSAMGNYLTPFQGGAAIRALYLKSRHDLPYSLFLSTLSTLYVLTFATSAAIGLLATLGLYIRLALFQTTLVAFFLGLLCLPCVLFVLVRIMPPLKTAPDTSGTANWFKKVIQKSTFQVIQGWQIISTRRAVLARLITISILNVCVTMLMINVSFAAFHIKLPILESLVLSSLFMVSSMIPITPSGLGVAEAAIIVVAQGFVDNRSLSSLSAGLNRSIMIINSIAWGISFSYILSRKRGMSPDTGPDPCEK
jgi:uncharacterized protein (TIRG00374 family)